MAELDLGTGVVLVIGLDADDEEEEISATTRIVLGSQAVHFYSYQLADLFRRLVEGTIDDRSSHMYLHEPIWLIDELSARENKCRQELQEQGYTTKDGVIYRIE